MRRTNCLFSFLPLIALYLVLFFGQAQSQFNISARDLPAAIGTLIITEDDIVNEVPIDVGFGGRNQTWRLDQPYPSVLSRQLIVHPDSTPYRTLFPDANMAVWYKGRLGNILHSWYFDDISGEFFGYENLANDSLMITGFATDSAYAEHGRYHAIFRGNVSLVPSAKIHKFPMRYGDNWKTVSQFSVVTTEMIATIPIKLTADIHDSMYNVVDGTGDIILPTASYKGLRVKSYITLVEKIYMNDVLYRERKSRTINYYWIAQSYGVVARVISYCNEADDRFVNAKQVSRLHKFDPQIGLAMEQLSGKRGAIINMPIQISDLTDLDVRAICMQVGVDTNILKPQGIVCSGTMAACWPKSTCAITHEGIQIDLKGDAPLAGTGCLCFIQFLVNPKASKNGPTPIQFQQVTVTERGPKIKTANGRFILLPGNMLTGPDAGAIAVSVPTAFQLSQNFPNPFNPTTTIAYQLPEAAQVVLNVFDLQGHLVRNLIHESQNAGYHQLIWNGRDESGALVASGAYFYRLDAKSTEKAKTVFVDVKTMTLLK